MDKAVYNSWVKIHRELKGFVERKVKDQVLAEDIVQDIFLKLHSKNSQIREAEKISAWLYQVARNTIIDHYRKQSRSIQATDLDWESEQHILNDCVAHCLNELVKTLPPKYKEALELTEKENLSQLELSARLDISYSGAKSRVQRARALLREKLETLYHVETDAYGNVLICEDKQPCGCDAQQAVEQFNMRP